jgi:hypothetical protein
MAIGPPRAPFNILAIELMAGFRRGERVSFVTKAGVVLPFNFIYNHPFVRVAEAASFGPAAAVLRSSTSGDRV